MRVLGNVAALVFLVFVSSCGSRESALFEPISSDHSGIHFANTIVENDSVNPIKLTNVYNGGGVGVGDFNNDGLQDLYFTGNQVANQLYINRGSLKFEDVTREAGVDGEGKWCRGAAVVDINNDGWQDIYVCASISNDPERRRNMLYVNQGAGKDGIPHFKNLAAEYGLDDTSHTTMAAFFDYDNDGDLDVYLVVNEIIHGNIPSVFRPIIRDGSFPSTGRLFRNDWDSVRQHPFYTNVTREAGVTIEGYGHGVNIADINRDGWKDIYVSNDFNSCDLLYINNHDGSFTDKSSLYFKHTAANGMGQDIVDINNDGLSDVVELDMNPEDNFRKKTMLGTIGYRIYQNSDHFGYQYQYVRNSLQVNQGPRVLENDSVGEPVFGDLGFFAGMAETDWSWTPLVADFDNDGWRDIIITNGFPRDVTDHDFLAFRRESGTIASEEFVLSQIPIVKIDNYAYRNMGGAHFENVTQSWGLKVPSFSNGSVYADLDGDGDLDVVVNNINDEAFVYENTANTAKEIRTAWLKIQFEGSPQNKNGLGAWADIYYNQGERQSFENTPYRGYLSSVQPGACFGLGKATVVDSVVVRWPGNRKQLITQVKPNQLLKVRWEDANLPDSWVGPALDSTSLFTDITRVAGVNYIHQERDFIDYDRERLLPHKLSQFGPALAVGDVNRDGLDDICVGGNSGFPGSVLLQLPGGKFQANSLPAYPGEQREDMGVLLFDADGDGDEDLYCASGSSEFPAGSPSYQDRLLVNDGHGRFVADTTALPADFTSKSCVKAADFDQDGDLDLFIGGRCLPGKYPTPVSSFVYRNDSKGGRIRFTDVTSQVAPGLSNSGMTCDAIWTDYDRDGWIDLIVVGEWMPVSFYHNRQGRFENVTAATGIGSQIGWWNSITTGDFDNDGDIDYVIGNLGLNSFFRASDKEPVSVYAKDFDKNSSIDAVLTVFLKDKDGNRREFPAMSRDDIVSQMPGVRKRFQTYREFGDADIHQIFPDEQMKGALVMRANNFHSALAVNKGGGKFELVNLPDAAQIAPIFGMVAEDFNGDGNLDLAISGDDYGNEVFNGRYDAMNGLVMLGDGKGGFKPLSILESGIFVPRDAKAMVQLRSGVKDLLLAGSQNQGPVKVFRLRSSAQLVALQPGETRAELKFRNGRVQAREFFYGSSFLSQSGRVLRVGKDVVELDIYGSKGSVRKLTF